MSTIRIENLTKRYGQTVAVDRFSLDVADGELVSLLGPSGCGKTTILRIIAGFVQPDNGKMFFDGENVTSLHPNKRKAAMVFQNYALFPHMTVFENVAFGLKAGKNRLSRLEIAERVKAALEKVKLTGLEARPVPQLSGGQQQRVALARAIVIEPRILLLDEPLSNLDAKLREETREEIRSLQKNLKVTTIYVTHDQTEAMAISDRMVVIKDGVAQQAGTPPELYFRPANLFVAQFLRRANLFRAKVVGYKDGSPQLLTAGGLSITASRVADTFHAGEEVTVSVPREALELGQGEISAQVVDSRFAGYLMECTLRLNATETAAATLSSDMGHRTLVSGDTVKVKINQERVAIFKREKATADERG